jgi:transposase
MSQVHIITGPERRRRWSEEQKRAIVAAAFAPGAVVSEVARRADICTSLIYRWRRRFGSAPGGFAEVMVGRDALAAAPGAPSIEVAFTGRSHVRIPASIPPDLAAAVIKALIGR